MVEIRIKDTEIIMEEIGELDKKCKVPAGQGMKCAHCGEKIESGQALLGLKAGYRYMFFHEVCVNQKTLFHEATGEVAQ